MTRLRNYFLTGFIVCAPLAITAYIAWSFIGWVDSWVKPYIPGKLQPRHLSAVPGAGLRADRGALPDHHDRLPDRQFHRPRDRLLRRIPAQPHAARAQHLQRAEADLRDGAVEQGRHVLARSASSNIRARASGRSSSSPARKTARSTPSWISGDDPTVAVFMPCTPNPTTGFLMYAAEVGRHRAVDDRRGRGQG